MSFVRVFVWSCNTCPATEQKEGFGLPTGWVAHIQMNRPIMHTCPTCAKAGRVPSDPEPTGQG